VGRRYLRWGAAALAIAVPIAVWLLLPLARERPPYPFPAARRAPLWLPAASTRDQRARALRQARVWRPVDPRGVDLTANPPDPDGTLSEPLVRCQYLPGPVRGTTPKFDCVLKDGEVVKVKYGRTGEIPAEVAATRLLSALGFGADSMYVIPRVRCYGCVRTPFYTMWALDLVGIRSGVERSIPADRYTDFEWVAVERRFPGFEIVAERARRERVARGEAAAAEPPSGERLRPERGAGGQPGGAGPPSESERGWGPASSEEEGWAWFELEAIDAARGANRAERDALRLAAILLSHWDNKAANQRLMCLSDQSPCPQPFAYIHDLGATFGPNKVDLAHWKAVPIWKDAKRCVVSMRDLPYGGGTFRETRISEAGRQLIARELSALSDDQIRSLFAAARFPAFFESGAAADVAAWSAAFRDKVTQIASAGPCE
jgi:hypothetical protein